ncbi:MAG: hypothetical protein HGA31_06440 [Candidatus Moranbacteria bacterium]|nr:hypothetical protein [Candidatus Moranbacteria bacterium]
MNIYPGLMLAFGLNGMSMESACMMILATWFGMFIYVCIVVRNRRRDMRLRFDGLVESQNVGSLEDRFAIEETALRNRFYDMVGDVVTWQQIYDMEQYVGEAKKDFNRTVSGLRALLKSNRDHAKNADCKKLFEEADKSIGLVRYIEHSILLRDMHWPKENDPLYNGDRTGYSDPMHDSDGYRNSNREPDGFDGYR